MNSNKISYNLAKRASTVIPGMSFLKLNYTEKQDSKFSMGGNDMRITIQEYVVNEIDSGPYGITVGKDGALWFTEQKGNQIGRINATGEINSFPIPTANAGAMSIISDQTGDLWFTEYNSSKIGKMSMNGLFEEYVLPTTNAAPFGITEGPDGAIWFTEMNNGRIGRITKSGKSPSLNCLTPNHFPLLLLWDQTVHYGLHRIRTIGLGE